MVKNKKVRVRAASAASAASAVSAEVTDVGLLEYTLIRRVNRHLVKSGRKLLKNRKPRSTTGRPTEREQALGTYFVVKVVPGLHKRGYSVVETHVDLAELARRLDVMAAYEGFTATE